MVHLKPLFVLLSACFAYLTTAVELDVNHPNHKFHGGANGVPHFQPIPSDSLLSTYCHCYSAPMPDLPPVAPWPSDWKTAEYINHEYYNTHSNTTFIWDHLCMMSDGNPRNCLEDQPDQRLTTEPLTPDKKDKDILCRSWEKEDADPYGHGTLCFDRGLTKNHDDKLLKCLDDPKGPRCNAPTGETQFIHWNGQKRWLHNQKGQIETYDPNVEELCGAVCGLLDMVPMKVDIAPTKHVLKSRQIGIMELDDMCPWCK